jgi:Protein of unknown function (DUF3613)
MHRRISIAVSFSLLSASALSAAELSTESSGEATRRWLELQRSGAVASSNRQTVSGPMADQIHQRYLKSFKHPIPEFYYQEKRSRGSSGGVTSGQ